ncbi:glycosyltransferase family 2 protein [Curvibacter sp. CHRR-16]|uniref:glycosyltransferase family 2 protein n=1 Tax=Curvibacter sp. CHRR-16 TaxID=2835872 RepID=UPI001BD9E79E|nr:glycosyltransferase family 2 protein [Curvibacter sp. CHRR-16]MBT0571785.1 glycosyltransferase family 2 protein [Curvibacter sp. CHRR-16]
MKQESSQVYSKTEGDFISIVITTYNRSDALIAVLQGLEWQADRAFEVIVADDGSRPEHVQAIHEYAQASALSIRHIWHPDVGFTAAQVRNMGVSQAKGNYIVLLDGDCVPERDFVTQHRRLRARGCFVNGSRVLLTAVASQDLMRHARRWLGQGIWFWMVQRWYKHSNKWLPLLRLPDGAYRVQGTFRWKGIRSCNMGVWRDDYWSVNGFDETFVGWGHEDADFVLRLHNAGLQRKNGFAATEVYHLWHQEAQRDHENHNAQKVHERSRTGLVQAELGLHQATGYDQMRLTSWR